MAAKFVVTASSADLAKCLSQIGALDGKSRLAVEKAMQRATKRIKAGAIRRVAVRSGELKKSISSGFSATKLQGVVRAKKPYAHLVEFGAKAVTIKPKEKKAMKIPFGEEYIVRKKVSIPARKPRPFIIPAYEAEAPELVDEIKKELLKNAKITK